MERATGNFGEMLLRDGLITNSQLDEAIKKHRQTGKSIGRILVEMGVISETSKLNTLKKRFGSEIVSLSDMEIPSIILTYIPKSFAVKHHLAPVRLDRDGLVVAMEDPLDLITIDNLKTLVGFRIKPVASASDEIESVIEKIPDTGGPESLTLFPREKSALYRAIRYSAFPIFCFLPIPLFIFFVPQINFIFNYLSKADKFDIFLYFLIGWGFWAIVLYEANGLIFGESAPKPKPREKEEEEK